MNKTIQDIIHYLMPHGTRGIPGCIEAPPRWPPDIFGLTAYIAEKSDCYCELLDFSQGGIGSILIEEQDTLLDAGKYIASCADFRMLPTPIETWLSENWTILSNSTESLLYQPNAEKPAWILATLRLLIVADIACAGMGFYSAKNLSETSDLIPAPDWIKRVYDWMALPAINRAKLCMDYRGDDWFTKLAEAVQQMHSFPKTAPVTACIFIPQDRLCVLPKALTPAVGCTIRSITQNLSLHPGAGQVKSVWHNHQFDMDDQDIDKLNVLIIPFPYKIASTSFSPSTSINHFSSFSVQQDWLSPASNSTTRIFSRHSSPDNDVVALTKGLIDQSKAEGRPVDVVLLPELALDYDTYFRLVDEVAALSDNRFTLVIAGVSYTDDNGDHRNASFTAYIDSNQVEAVTYQNKHHRWKLDRTQIQTYALETTLNDAISATGDWWEATAIRDRVVNYHVFQKGACFATLICEDLARQDPCKTTLQATGPNLVFALLMDAPQLSSRWPGRYTLGLTEDPGSSVLTVTSLGLVERSNWAYNGSRQTIALWGNQHGVREIDLPLNYHGVLLSLVRHEKSMYTLDQREGKGVFWKLNSLTPLKIDNL